jgi:membrane-associated phospholipid phosphatase
MAYVDRPTADYVHAHVARTHLIMWLEHQLGRLVIFVGLGFLVLVACGLWELTGRELPSWTEIPVLCSWSLMWATAATVTLKRLFGRSEVELWIGHDANHPGINRFHFLHGEGDYQAFPSGTTTVASAIIIVVWILAPRLRPLCLLALVLISIGLIVTNSHFVADVIGGIFAGSSIAWMTVRLLRPSAEPL